MVVRSTLASRFVRTPPLTCRNRAFEVLALAVSYLGPEAMAANSVVGTAQFVFYQPALAISIAASVRLGNLLGANREIPFFTFA